MVILPVDNQRVLELIQGSSKGKGKGKGKVRTFWRLFRTQGMGDKVMARFTRSLVHSAPPSTPPTITKDRDLLSQGSPRYCKGKGRGEQSYSYVFFNAHLL